MTYKNILCLDSSTAKHLVLRLWHGEHHFDAPYEISSLEDSLISNIDQLLQQAQLQITDIDLFVLGSGPGSFMGLRLGFSVIRTFAWLYQKPIFLVSSLDLLTSSNKYPSNSLVVPCIDAKMKKVFCKIFHDEKELLSDSDLSPSELVTQIKAHSAERVILCGSGAPLVSELLPDAESYDSFVTQCSAFDRDFLNQITSEQVHTWEKDKLASVEPLYLRLSAAEEALKNK